MKKTIETEFGSKNFYQILKDERLTIYVGNVDERDFDQFKSDYYWYDRNAEEGREFEYNPWGNYIRTSGNRFVFGTGWKDEYSRLITDYLMYNGDDKYYLDLERLYKDFLLFQKFSGSIDDRVEWRKCY